MQYMIILNVDSASDIEAHPGQCRLAVLPVSEDETILHLFVPPHVSAHSAALCVPGWRCWPSAGRAVLLSWMRSPERAPVAVARRGRCPSSRQKPLLWLSLTATACRCRCLWGPSTCPGRRTRRRQTKTPLSNSSLRHRVCGRILP